MSGRVVTTRKKKPRRGRPPGPPENVRRCLVVLRLTADEHVRIAAAAKVAQEGLAEWMRRICLQTVDRIDASSVSGSRRQP